MGQLEREFSATWRPWKAFIFLLLLPAALAALYVFSMRSIDFVSDKDNWGKVIAKIQDTHTARIAVQNESFAKFFLSRLGVFIGKNIDASLGINGSETININLKQKRFEQLSTAISETKDKWGVDTGMNALYDLEHRGTVDWRGRTSKAKISLKGYGPDHRADPKKWSLAIKLGKDEFIMGMNKFAVHDPKTRQWQSECMFNYVLQKFSLISRKCFVVNLTINGNPIGLMTLTEGISNHMLEPQGKKEGIVLKPRVDWIKYEVGFRDYYKLTDEWAALPEEVKIGFQAGTHHSLLNVLVDTLDTYDVSNVRKSPVLEGQYFQAVRLWEGLLRGNLKPSDVFDLPKTSRTLVIALVLARGHVHSLQVHNFRLYFNPLTSLFEVFPTDLQSFGGAPKEVAPKEQLTEEFLPILLLSDEKIKAQMIVELEKLLTNYDNFGHPLGDEFTAYEQQFLDELALEYPFLDKWNKSDMVIRIKQVIDQAKTSTFFEKAQQERRLMPVIKHYPLENVASARFFKEGEYLKINILNAYALNFYIRNISLKYKDSMGVINEKKISMNRLLPPTYGIGHIDGVRDAGEVLLSIKDNQVPGELVGGTIDLRQVDQDREYSVRLERYAPGFKSHPLASQSIPQLQKEFPFLKINDNEKIVNVPSGNWTFEKFAVFPKGYSVVVEEAAILNFSKDAGWLIFGALQLNGRTGAKIRLVSKDESAWRGIFVSQANFFARDKKSIVSFAEFSKTKNIELGDWGSTGAVTFYESDVEIRGSIFKETSAEDALNIVHSRFSIENSIFSDTRSDALDTDFSNGSIFSSTFKNVGGDAVDFSGSLIELGELRFDEVEDKAISAGESSTVKASNIEISKAGTGVASKDASHVTISNVSFYEIVHEHLMSYTKKEQYSPPSLIATNVVFDTPKMRAMSQNGSTLIVNRKRVSTVKIDTKALYKGYMKK
jgi:hypothetical protein